MHSSPEFATEVGYPGLNDRWSDYSSKAIEKRKIEAQTRLKTIQEMDRSSLNSDDQFNYDLFLQIAQQDVESFRFPSELIPITQMTGIQHSIPSILLQAPKRTQKDYLDRISRLEKIPLLIEQVIQLMKLGLQKEITLPKVVMKNVPEQIKSLGNPEMRQNPLFVSFQEIPSSFSPKVRAYLQKKATETLKNKVAPAIQAFHEFVSTTYLPQCREKTAWRDLPNGKDWYLYQVRHHTTTSLSPEQIHELGLSEVKRIRAEMEKIKNSLGSQEPLNQFVASLSKNPNMVHKSKKEFISEFESYIPELQPKLSQFFKRSPKLDCQIKPVPEFSERSQPAAYLEPGSIELGRPSVFFANTFDLTVIPKWRMRTLFLHEAIPGHHFQLALAQENRNLPEFRKYLGYTAFVEGWALYTETLGYDLQFFKDPYSKLGQLSDELLRASRLVVDTGMHHLGWSRERALDYFRENTFTPEQDCVVEINRYLVLPGQALAYKVGQLTFQTLRQKAQDKLGDRFDIREFHDLFLRNGTLPLNILESLVDRWIMEQKT